MARPPHAPRRFVPFKGVGHRLGDGKTHAVPHGVKKMKAVQSISAPKKMKAVQSISAPKRPTQKSRPSAALKPTTMGRIVGDQVKEAACEPMMQKGLDWAHKPRATRSTPATPAVTRKTKDSVVTISREAEDMLTAVLGSANIATHHAKRKTLKVDDMKLVNGILGKCGSYAGLLGF